MVDQPGFTLEGADGIRLGRKEKEVDG